MENARTAGQKGLRGREEETSGTEDKEGISRGMLGSGAIVEIRLEGAGREIVGLQCPRSLSHTVQKTVRHCQFPETRTNQSWFRETPRQ